MTFEAPESPYLVPFDGSFDIKKASTDSLTDGHRHKGEGGSGQNAGHRVAFKDRIHDITLLSGV